jgi:AcrR family transcriptional regulator
MVKSKAEAKEKIIIATTELIKEYGDISKITIRDIAVKAEVGVGLINYHFQTKENLIDLCILRIISYFIEELESLYKDTEMNPIGKLKHAFKLKCAYVAANPEIARISMLLDLNSDSEGDNTDRAARVHFKGLREIFGYRKTDGELFVILHTLMASIQGAFLRNNVFKAHTGIDFFDDDQRESFIDSLIDELIGGGELC